MNTPDTARTNNGRIELKPCPKGHPAEFSCTRFNDNEEATEVEVICTACEWCNGTWPSKEAAAEAWNARPQQVTEGLREAELLRLLRFAHDSLIELNPSNYSHEDVCEANNAAVEVLLAIAPALGEKHGKTDEWWKSRLAASPTTPPPA